MQCVSLCECQSFNSRKVKVKHGYTEKVSSWFYCLLLLKLPKNAQFNKSYMYNEKAFKSVVL